MIISAFRRIGSIWTSGAIALAFFFLAAAVALPVRCMASETFPPSAPRPLGDFSGSIADLIEGAARYDGQTVTLEGEVIGDVMIRGQKAWVNISDQPTASIGVRASAIMVKTVEHAGTYRVRGDRVRVTGVFRRSSSSEGGELCIEAIDIQKIAAGGPIERPITSGRLVRAGLGILAALLLGAFWLKAIRSEKHSGPDFVN